MDTYDPEQKETDFRDMDDILLTSNVGNDEHTIYLKSPDIIVIDNVLSLDECDIIKQKIDECPNARRSKYKKKIISKCDRLSKIIQKRCHKYIDECVYKNYDFQGKHTEDANYWVKPYINPSWRFTRCQKKSNLGTHFDGIYVKSIDHCSLYTMMIYLTDNEDGELFFIDQNLKVKPKPGRVVIFNLNLLHSGLINTTIKYFMRSEIMYHRKLPIETLNDQKAMMLYVEAQSQNYTNPERAHNLEARAFKLSPLLEDVILN